MKVRIPREAFEELEGLIKAYDLVRQKVFHGTIDNGGVILSWDSNGNMTVENDIIEEVN